MGCTTLRSRSRQITFRLYATPPFTLPLGGVQQAAISQYWTGTLPYSASYSWADKPLTGPSQLLGLWWRSVCIIPNIDVFVFLFGIPNNKPQSWGWFIVVILEVVDYWCTTLLLGLIWLSHYYCCCWWISMSWRWFVTSFTKKKNRPSISTHGNESYPPNIKHPKILWIKKPY